MSASGQKQICATKSDVRFTPNSDRKSGFPHKVMSALPPKADMCAAARDVRFGPIADIACLFDHFIGRIQQAKWHIQAQRFGRLQVDHELEFCRLHNR